MKRLIKNIARCRKCNTIVESAYRRDFKFCECGSIFVDGGKDYIRRGGNLEDIEDLSEYVEIHADSDPQQKP